VTGMGKNCNRKEKSLRSTQLGGRREGDQGLPFEKVTARTAKKLERRKRGKAGENLICSPEEA